MYVYIYIHIYIHILYIYIYIYILHIYLYIIYIYIYIHICDINIIYILILFNIVYIYIYIYSYIAMSLGIIRLPLQFFWDGKIIKITKLKRHGFLRSKIFVKKYHFLDCFILRHDKTKKQKTYYYSLSQPLLSVTKNIVTD